ncbi:hypothetical protein N9917_02315 [Deltaproteobacteria bacterium]|nr:hypothetical protein [Deltaproteobacteria bacterium]
MNETIPERIGINNTEKDGFWQAEAPHDFPGIVGLGSTKVEAHNELIMELVTRIEESAK